MFNKLLYKGHYGIERETIRIDNNGKFAKTYHQFDENKFIKRDFCENQLEIITPVCNSIDELMKKLEELDNIVRKELKKKNEGLWLYSNPPHYESENDIIIAKLNDIDKKEIFEKSAKIYGKKFFTLSGIHFNFSFDDEYLHTICNNNDFEKFNNDFYIKLLKYLCKYSWLLVLLTSASPICDKSFITDKKSGIINRGYAS